MVIWNLNKSKCKKTLTLHIAILLLIVLGIFYYVLSIYNSSEHFPDKTVIDIRNMTNHSVSDMYLEIYVPKGYEPYSKYYEGKISIPVVQKRERLVAVLDQETLSSPGMKLSLNYKGESYIIIDELRGKVGSTCIITINKNDLLNTKDISDYAFKKKHRFSYQKPNRTIFLNAD